MPATATAEVPSPGLLKLRRLLDAARRTHLAPPPKLTVSEWADKHRIVSSYSAEPGPWRTDRTPYLREIMDALGDPSVQMVVFMKCARIGGTEAGLNIVGYFIDQDPSPIMIVQPTVDDAKDFSKEQLAPMLADTACLTGKVRDPKSRDSGNTVQSKVYPGGAMYLVGANSPRGFRRRTVRVLDLEEIDGYPASAGTEGDQIKLAVRRTATFSYRRKIYMNSTPTLKGYSRIEDYFERGDQRRYHVPCPHCQTLQALVWKQLTWDEGKPETAQYACGACGALIPEEAKHQMVAAGRWISAEPGRPTRSYHLNALYSPWVSWPELAAEWLEAQEDNGKLQVFVNTALAETWEDRGGKLDPSALEQRDRMPGLPLPAGVGLLTCGVDVQDDRLEAILRGWGRAEESWLIERRIFLGNPDEDRVWEDFDAWRREARPHSTGALLQIDTCCIDSGAHTDAVYRYVKPRFSQRVYATKGASTVLNVLVNPRPTVNNKGRVRLFLVGTEKVKDTIYDRLRLTVPGPRFMWFTPEADDDYFAQLTAEKPVRKWVNGRYTRRWELPRGQRSEVLDCEGLCLVALQLSRVRVERLGELVDRLAQAAQRAPASPAPVPEVVRTETPVPARRGHRPRGAGWMSGLLR